MILENQNPIETPSKFTFILRLTPLRSELAVRKHRGHSGVRPASSVRVRAVDSARSPKHIAEATLFMASA